MVKLATSLRAQGVRNAYACALRRSRIAARSNMVPLFYVSSFLFSSSFPPLLPPPSSHQRSFFHTPHIQHALTTPCFALLSSCPLSLTFLWSLVVVCSPPSSFLSLFLFSSLLLSSPFSLLLSSCSHSLQVTPLLIGVGVAGIAYLGKTAARVLSQARSTNPSI